MTSHLYPLDVVDPDWISEVVTLNTKLFMIWQSKVEDPFSIRVYERNNVTVVKDIPLPGMNPISIAACSVSNCIYILNNEPDNCSVLRLTIIDKPFVSQTSPFISNLQRQFIDLCIEANGSLVMSRKAIGEESSVTCVISVYRSDGELEYEIRFATRELVYKVIPKSNGNFVIVSANDNGEAQLTEINKNGGLVRQYQSSLRAFNRVCEADVFGRVVILGSYDAIEILDCEFNPTNFTGRLGPLYDSRDLFCDTLHFHRDNNEIVMVSSHSHATSTHMLSTFHFVEE